jgi:hypothetical protein
MADEIQKEITVKVKMESNVKEHVKDASDTVNGFINSVKTFGNSIGKTFSDSFKSIFSNVAGYYKKPLDEASKAIIEANTKTNATVEKNIKASQDKIRASEIESAQKTSDAVFNIITKGIDERRDAQVRGLEDQRKAIDNNTSLTAADKKTRENNLYKQEDAIKRNAFKQEQKYNIAQAIMNGASRSRIGTHRRYDCSCRHRSPNGITNCHHRSAAASRETSYLREGRLFSIRRQRRCITRL